MRAPLGPIPGHICPLATSVFRYRATSLPPQYSAIKNCQFRCHFRCQKRDFSHFRFQRSRNELRGGCAMPRDRHPHTSCTRNHVFYDLGEGRLVFRRGSVIKSHCLTSISTSFPRVIPLFRFTAHQNGQFRFQKVNSGFRAEFRESGKQGGKPRRGECWGNLPGRKL